MCGARNSRVGETATAVEVLLLPVHQRCWCGPRMGLLPRVQVSAVGQAPYSREIAFVKRLCCT